MPMVGPYDFRIAENVDGIAESSHKKKRNLLYNAECHGICQILDEYLKTTTKKVNLKNVKVGWRR